MIWILKKRDYITQFIFAHFLNPKSRFRFRFQKFVFAHCRTYLPCFLLKKLNNINQYDIFHNAELWRIFNNNSSLRRITWVWYKTWSPGLYSRFQYWSQVFGNVCRAELGKKYCAALQGFSSWNCRQNDQFLILESFPILNLSLRAEVVNFSQIDM